MTTNWLDRTLVLGPHLALCLSEEEFRAAEKHVGWPASRDKWCHAGDGARTHMEFDSGKPVAIVCMLPVDNRTAVAGLMAHEAVHIWHTWLESMGETAPGEEITAYAVQNLVVLLLDEYERRMQEGA